VRLFATNQWGSIWSVVSTGGSGSSVPQTAKDNKGQVEPLLQQQNLKAG
jgi:hypothetical protein